MKRSILAVMMVLAATSVLAKSVVKTGKAAPDFSLKDSAGVEWSLSAQKGKIVVLEWTNPGCPFVVKHYDTGNMQKLQKEAVTDGVVWVSINSSAEGKQGHLSSKEAAKLVKKLKVKSAAYLLDPNGKVGKKYGAVTTPHMFVIDAKGRLVYQGAIDDQPSFQKDTVKGARNYVRDALKALKDGGKIDPAETKPYGCGVKY